MIRQVKPPALFSVDLSNVPAASCSIIMVSSPLLLRRQYLSTLPSVLVCLTTRSLLPSFSFFALLLLPFISFPPPLFVLLFSLPSLLRRTLSASSGSFVRLDPVGPPFISPPFSLDLSISPLFNFSSRRREGFLSRRSPW